MKTLLQNQKAKLFLSTVVISVLSSSLLAEQKTLSYTDVKSKITQGERIYLLKQRDTLAQNIANREVLYISSVIDIQREKRRAQRIK